ncbi:MAG: hypothetical protein ABR548_00475 [Actinomycetota bacterium]|nr:hypothetical protein [Actinomycetota bacterium]
MRKYVAALVAVTALATAACAKENSLALVTGASSKTLAAKTARISVVVSAGGLQMPAGNISADGAFDFTARRGLMSIDASSLGLPAGVGKIETRVIGTVIYMKIPTLADQLQGKTWLKLDFQAAGKKAGVDISSLQQLQSNDPTAALNFLRGATSIETVGTARVRGATTTHYRARVDLVKAAGKVTADQKTALTNAAAILGDRAIPMDVWVDKAGRMRRLTYTVDFSKVRLPKSSGIPQRSGTLTMTMELYDFGISVDVAAPPAPDVADYGALTGEGSGIGSITK